MTQRPNANERAAPLAPCERNGTRFDKYVWLALILVAVTQGGAAAFRMSLFPSTVRPPHHPISQIPVKMGQWTGKPTAVTDKRIFEAVGADDQVNLEYSNAAGDWISAHCAVWQSATVRMPHVPPECYGTSGWKLVKSETVQLPGHSNIWVALQHYEQLERRAVIAYWYQLGERTFFDRRSERAQRRMLWGQREWPPLVKVLLHTPERDDSEQILRDLASQIYDYARGL